MITLANHAMAADDQRAPMRVPTEERPAFLQTDQRLPIRPSVIASTGGHVIVAGYSGTRAWAAKTDLAGKVSWTYHMDKPGGYDASPWLQVRPEFRSAAVLADGSVWLVGSTIDAGSQVGLLAHLDREGKVIENRTAVPPLGVSQGAHTHLLIDCLPWGDGVAIAGSTTLLDSATASHSVGESPSSRPSPRKPAFWMLILDAGGRTTFEEVIPTGYARSIGGPRSGVTLLAAGSQLFVSAQTGADTELLLVDTRGTARIQKHYANTFLHFVRPVVPDGKLQLLGTLLSEHHDTLPKPSFSVVLITLRDDLSELRRQPVPQQIVPKISYRLPDESLAIFGAEVHQVGEQYTSQVVHIDGSLGQVQILNPSRADYSDAGMIDTAAPLDSAGRFAFATVAVVRGFPDNPAHIDAFPGFLRGAALAVVAVD